MTETGIITTVYIAGFIFCGVLLGVVSHKVKWNDTYLDGHLLSDVFMACLLWPLLIVLAIVAFIVLSPFLLTRLVLCVRGGQE